MPRMAVCSPSARNAEVSTARVASWNVARMQFRACTLQQRARKRCKIKLKHGRGRVGALEGLHPATEGAEKLPIKPSQAKARPWPGWSLGRRRACS